MRHVAKAQVETRGLDVVGVDCGTRANVSTGDQVGDFLRGQDSRGPGSTFFICTVRPVLKSNLTLVGCGHLQDSPCLTESLRKLRNRLAGSTHLQSIRKSRGRLLPAGWKVL